MEDVMLFVLKVFFIEDNGINLVVNIDILIMPKVVFPSMKVFVEKTLFSLMQKKLVQYFQLALATCNLATYTFDFFFTSNCL